MINVHIPGSGITPFNVYDLELWFWRIYRAAAQEAIKPDPKGAPHGR